MLRLLFISFIITLLLSPVTAQEEIWRLGGTLPGELAWSPSGDRLAAATSDGVYVYRSHDFNLPPARFDGGMNVKFLEGGIIISGEHRWNVATGTHYALPEVPLKKTPLGTYTYNSTDQGGILRVTFLNTSENFTIDLGENLYLVHTEISPNETYAAFVVQWQVEYQTFREIQLWHLKDLYRVAELPIRQGVDVKLTRFSNDETKFLMFDGHWQYGVYGPITNDQLHLWDTGNGQLIVEYDGWDHPFTISPDNRWIAYATWNELLIWNGNELLYTGVNATEVWTGATAFSANSTTLAANARGVDLWRLDTEKGLAIHLRNLQPSNHERTHLYLSRDGSLMLIGLKDTIPVIWNVTTASLVTQIQTSYILDQVQFSPDNTLVMLQDATQRDVTIWNTATGALVYTFPNHVRFNHDWSKAAYWNECNIMITDMTSGDEIILNPINPYYGKPVAFNTESGWAVFETHNAAAIYELSTGEKVAEFPLIGTVSRVLFGKGQKIAILDRPLHYRRGMQAHLWGLETQITIELGYFSNLIDLSSDGNLLIYAQGYPYENIYLYDSNTGEQLAELYQHTTSIHNQILAPDSQYLITTNSDYPLWFWQIPVILQKAKDTQELTILDDESYATSYNHSEIYGSKAPLSLSPTGHYLILRCDEQAMCAYDIQNMPETAFGNRENDYYFEDTGAVVFSPDEQYVFLKSYSEDQWFFSTLENLNRDISLTGKGLPAFSENGEWVAFVEEGQISVWQTDELLNGNLTPAKIIPLPETSVQEIAFKESTLYIRDDTGISIWEIGIAESTR